MLALIRALKNFVRALLRRPLETYADSPDLFHAYRGLASHPSLTRKPGGWQYQGRFYPDYLTVGGASRAIERVALKFCKGKGVDVGSGYWPLEGAIAADAARGPGQQRSIREFADASLDYVFSSHCLEHIAEWREELAVWIAKLKPGGALFLYLPHPECGLWQPGSPMVGDGHVWVPTFGLIDEALRASGLAVIDADPGPDAMESFYVCGRKPA